MSSDRDALIQGLDNLSKPYETRLEPDEDGYGGYWNRGFDMNELAEFITQKQKEARDAVHEGGERLFMNFLYKLGAEVGEELQDDTVLIRIPGEVWNKYPHPEEREALQSTTEEEKQDDK
jgi:hypothetical protein